MKPNYLVRLVEHASSSHGPDLEDVLDGRGYALEELVLGRGEQSDAIQFRNQDDAAVRSRGNKIAS